jgi:uncharacterized protein YaeQ
MLGLRLQLQIELEIENEAVGARRASERLFLVKKPGESLEHVLMKLLSYVLFFDPGLEVEASAEQHYKPDLLRLDERGEPVQWIDCGSTSLRKLDRITQRNRRSFIDIVKPSERELRLFKEAADRKLERPERVRYWAFADGFLDRLAERIHGRHGVRARVDAARSRLELEVDGEPLATPIVSLVGGR